MKKVLASLIIATAIIGGAVTYTNAHPEKQVSTVTNPISSIESEPVVSNVNSENENLNISDYMGDWRTSSLIGSLNSLDKASENQNATINITKENFKILTTLSNNVVSDVSVNKPVYQIQKLPDNYFRINFQREPEALGLVAKNNYQVIVNNNPSNIYISNGKLVYNSAGAFFSLSK